MLAKRRFLKRSDYLELLNVKLDMQILSSAYSVCAARYSALGGNDDVARGSTLVGQLKAEVAKMFPPTPKRVNLKLGSKK